MSTFSQPVVVRQLGPVDYAPTLARMQAFTDARDDATADEIWLLEHPPVFTLGTNADTAHVLAPGDIPVVQVDRGGQVTYHGPGQLVLYALLDLTRAHIGLRDLVCQLEQAVIRTLAELNIEAVGRRDAPGVYVDGTKIASIGLRVRRGRCYHGLALNVAPDLEPFQRINPCGYEGLAVTSIAALGHELSVAQAGTRVLGFLLDELGATAVG